MSKVVLVIAAHADDEVLGCGGAIAHHVCNGDRVYIIYMADGVSSRGGSDLVEYKRRKDACNKAQEILGVKQSFSLDFPDNRMDSVPLLDVVQRIEPIIQQIKPFRVYTHHHGDLNVDHQITHQAVITACRPYPENYVKEIFTFEVMSSTDWARTKYLKFSPNVFLDIEKYINLKIEALEAYEMEMRSVPHSRSLDHIKTLAKHRGYSVGLNAAEAFEVVRLII